MDSPHIWGGFDIHIPLGLQSLNMLTPPGDDLRESP
jgi:hypothetical protein